MTDTPRTEPKRKWWTVHRNDVGRELADPDWVEWAVAELSTLRDALHNISILEPDYTNPEEYVRSIRILAHGLGPEDLEGGE